jgi:hypothetical protein
MAEVELSSTFALFEGDSCTTFGKKKGLPCGYHGV